MCPPFLVDFIAEPMAPSEEHKKKRVESVFCLLLGPRKWKLQLVNFWGSGRSGRNPPARGGIDAKQLEIILGTRK